MKAAFPTRVIIILCHSVVFLAGLSGNICLFMVTFASKNTRKSLPIYLIGNLAVADFLVCLVVPPYSIVGLSMANPPVLRLESDTICKGYIFLSYVFGFVRILLLAVISLERFIAIVYPFFYNKHDISSWKCSRLVVMVGGPWIQAIVTTLPAMFITGLAKYKGDSESLCELSWHSSTMAYIIPVFILNFFLPSVVIFFTNVKVYAAARNQKKRISVCSSIPDQQRGKLHVQDPPVCVMQRDHQTSVADIIENTAANNSDTSGLNTPARKKKRGEDLKREISESPLQIFPGTSNISLHVHANATTPDGLTCEGPGFFERKASSMSTRDRSKNTQKLSIRSSTFRRARLLRKQNGNDYVAFFSTLCVVTTFFITWFPFAVTAIIEMVSRQTVPIEVDLFTSTLIVVDSALTPFVVLGTRRKLRLDLVKKLTGKSTDTD